jgi:hypothetical protein
MYNSEYKIYLTDDLVECEIVDLMEAMDMYAIKSFTTSLRIISIELKPQMKNESDVEVLRCIANWLDHIGAVEDIGKIQVITDYETDFISVDIKQLTGDFIQ